MGSIHNSILFEEICLQHILQTLFSSDLVITEEWILMLKVIVNYYREISGSCFCLKEKSKHFVLYLLYEISNNQWKSQQQIHTLVSLFFVLLRILSMGFKISFTQCYPCGGFKIKKTLIFLWSGDCVITHYSRGCTNWGRKHQLLVKV